MKLNSRFGRYGGTYVPQILVPALEELEANFVAALEDDAFNHELQELLADYAGRPTPLFECKRLRPASPTRVFLKREDLLHGGAHKTNQVLAQGLLAKRLGKTRLIAETGAGQHGVATAMVGALLGIPTQIYMGAKDVARQRPNVDRMKLFGAKVVAVEQGSQSLKDAVNEALRDWAASFESTHYVLGTAAGPHPFPTLVRTFQSVIGIEARAQFLGKAGALPELVVACVGGGSNAIGIFSAFIDDVTVALVGVEPAGRGLSTGMHGATLGQGDDGILHGSLTKVLQNSDGQILESHSVSAGLDYPGVGPEHAHLLETGRASYVSVTDDEAVAAFHELSRREGIIPALESAHAIAHVLKLIDAGEAPQTVLINLSGRGDKDLATVAGYKSEPETGPEKRAVR